MVDELIAAVRAALDGCVVSPTATLPAATPTAAVCSLAVGEYRLTQPADGELRLAGFSPWVVPQGGTITLEVDEAEGTACRRAVSVPFPGGLELPTFCVGGTNYSVQLSQTGCGVGEMASAGGDRYRVTTVADTSDTSAVCNTPASTCPPTMATDNAARVHVSVAEGEALCAADQPVQVLLSIPTRVRIWIETDACGSPFDPVEDRLIGEWSMVLDLTTGTATSSFADLDGDGCAISGIGPAAGFARTGTCFDASAGNKGDSSAVVVAAGVAAAGSPIYDVTFALTMPASLTGPHGGSGSSSPCRSAPPIAFAGAVDRCFSE